MNRVEIIAGGPIGLTGELELQWENRQERKQIWLCRCGKSADKPRCDGAHRVNGFSDSGETSGPGPGSSGQGCGLHVRGRKDGPLVLTGVMEIVDGTGKVAWRGDKTALCRCGLSGRKPFCDGSHRGSGFEAD